MMYKPTRRAARSLGVLTAAAVTVWSMGWQGAAVANAADTTAPSPPAEVQAARQSGTNDSVILTWQASSSTDVAFYQIFRSYGSGTPQAEEMSYLGRTAGDGTTFTDTVQAEGTFQYAVMAVDNSGNPSEASDWYSIILDVDGDGSVTPDQTAPGAPTGLTAGDSPSATRSVTLSWTAPASDDLWRYLLFRADGQNDPKLIAYPEADAAQYNEELTADGQYTYTLYAQDLAGHVSGAATVSLLADTIAPEVALFTPVMNQYYAADGLLPITAEIVEEGSGVAAIAYYLDDETTARSSNMLDLTTLEAGSHTVRMDVTDNAGNTGSASVTFSVIADTATDPLAPGSLTADLYQNSNVELDWTAPADGSVGQYMVYRVSSEGDDVAVMLTASTATAFVDKDVADGMYVYYVAAMLGTTPGPVSNAVVVYVDTAGPEIAITSPADEASYEAEGMLEISLTVEDATSGHDADDVAIYLDDEPFAGDEIDLAALEAGEHTLAVTATDRAGNASDASVTFSVEAPDQDEDDEDEDDEDEDEDEDDDEDEDEDREPVENMSDLIHLLARARGQIRNNGHYRAMLAKLQSGNVKGFVAHVQRHRGKFIPNSVAEDLLDAVEELGYDLSHPDADEESQGNRGKKR